MATTRRVAKPIVSPDGMGTTSTTPIVTSSQRYSPYLPTPVERIALGLFPLVLLFGTLFSILSPQTRSSPYDPVAQAHYQDSNIAPSYFAKKSNIFNVVFVKRGWGWVTFAFMTFLFSHPSTGTPGFVLTPRRFQAGLRWGMVTAFWFFVTQWFFGPAIIDRGFRWTGGRCEIAQREVEMGDTSLGEMVTAVACKASGGKWKGGHDISGHVFLLVLGTAFLMQEVGWSVLRWSGRQREERSVIMPDGALKSATVESESSIRQGAREPALGVGGKFAVGIMGLSVWMLLMTAIYFHTWFEKFTGLLTATLGYYIVYMVPRFVPALRQVVGLPGV
ncbi:Fc.00g108470.m01.CDS01 [Cosmosporella sp. VM-42]